MAKRIRIGLIFSYEENWIGGTYYFLSIIKSLNYLDDKKKPAIVAFIANEKDKDALMGVNYPYLSIQKLHIQSSFIHFLDRVIKKLTRWKIQPIEFWRNSIVDKTYLYRHDTPFFKGIKDKIFWVADFQEFVLRNYFTNEEFEYRSSVARYAATSGYTLVLSSEDSKRDFIKFFPNYKCKVYVVRFASIHPDFSYLDINSVKQKYGISKPYFICANQFWHHKNHMVILKALIEIDKSERLKFQVILTGKNFDYRSTDYFSRLMDFITVNNLSDTVKYIGFIGREEQLCLMKNSLSIIQPSLFEGWSTTVEDAKHLNARIILSDISVHKEQAPVNGIYFRARDEKDLAVKMAKVYNDFPEIVSIDYVNNIRVFANDFITAIENPKEL